MTDELEKEISLCLPKSNDIDKKTRKRSQKACTKAWEKLFPVGRVFASSYQLHQCLSKFMPQWACEPSNKENSI